MHDFPSLSEAVGRSKKNVEEGTRLGSVNGKIPCMSSKMTLVFSTKEYALRLLRIYIIFFPAI